MGRKKNAPLTRRVAYNIRLWLSAQVPDAFIAKMERCSLADVLAVEQGQAFPNTRQWDERVIRLLEEVKRLLTSQIADGARPRNEAGLLSIFAINDAKKYCKKTDESWTSREMELAVAKLECDYRSLILGDKFNMEW